MTALHHLIGNINIFRIWVLFWKNMWNRDAALVAHGYFIIASCRLPTHWTSWAPSDRLRFNINDLWSTSTSGSICCSPFGQIQSLQSYRVFWWNRTMTSQNRKKRRNSLCAAIKRSPFLLSIFMASVPCYQFQWSMGANSVYSLKVTVSQCCHLLMFANTHLKNSRFFFLGHPVFSKRQRSGSGRIPVLGVTHVRNRTWRSGCSLQTMTPPPDSSLVLSAGLWSRAAVKSSQSTRLPEVPDPQAPPSPVSHGDL